MHRAGVSRVSLIRIRSRNSQERKHAIAAIAICSQCGRDDALVGHGHTWFLRRKECEGNEGKAPSIAIASLATLATLATVKTYS